MKQLIVLASTSPRRVDMLGWLGIPFQAASSEFDESTVRHARPRQLTRLLAEAKAEAVGEHSPNSIVIGSDAVVSLDGVTLEKPKTKDQQTQMLQYQFGKNARVYSSVCVINTATGQKITKSRTTNYKVARPPEDRLKTYIESGQGMDKAGGYGNQDEDGMFLDELHGCYTNLIGFPLCDVARILRQMGVVVPVQVSKVVKENTGRNC